MRLIEMIRRLSFALFCVPLFAFPLFAGLAKKAEPRLGALGPLKKDAEYYQIPSSKNLDLIYSENLQSAAPVLSEYARRIEARLAKDFKLSPSKSGHVYFASSRWQVPNAGAAVYPVSFISIFPFGGSEFIDQSSVFCWLPDVLIHEMTHIYQLSQNSSLDRALFWLLGPLAYRNMFLGLWMLEGSAVLNESIYGCGGRLFSGWVRAFVFAQLKKGLSLKNLIKPYNDPISARGKYLHGGYFFAYLYSRYGGPQAVNKFFSESGRFFPADFYGLRASLKRAFGADLETLFKNYKKRWGALAREQKSSASKALLRSKIFAPMNSDKDRIYFLISDAKSPPRLAVFDKRKKNFKTIEKDLPLGKVFYKNGEYLSADSARTGSFSVEYSLFREGLKPIKKYNSQYVMDFHRDRHISLDTREGHFQNTLLLNGVFYDTSDSSAIMDHKGRIYYFKQEGDRRILHRDKKPVIGFKSYYGYPVEADEQGLYFIGAVRRGSGLFVYKEAEGAIFRLSDLDTVGYARKITGNEFLISEIGAKGFEYKIVAAKEIPEEPFLYEYSFKKENLFEAPVEASGAAVEEALAEASGAVKGGSKKAEGVSAKKEAELSGRKAQSDELSLSALESLEEESENLPLDRLTEELETSARLLAAGESEKPARFPAGQEPEKRSDLEGKKPLKKKKTALTQPKAYSSLKHLSLRQAVFFSSLDPYFISFFRFLDPLQWSDLAFFNSLGQRQKYFNLSYAYRKYRHAFEISLTYSESRLYQNIDHQYRIRTLRDIGFLTTKDIFDRMPLAPQTLIKKDYVFERLRALDLLWSYPLARKAYWNLSWINSLQLGQRQFNNERQSFSLFYKPQNWKDYIQHEGKLRYSFRRRYRYGYSSHKERLFQLSYNMLSVREAPGAYNFFLSGQAKARWTEELGKEWFAVLAGLAEKGLWSREPQSLRLRAESDVIASHSSFKRAAQSFYQMDFQILKAVERSFYPLKIPFWLKRWAPLAGFSALAMELEDSAYQFAFIPFLGAETEIGFLFEKIGFKAGLSAEYVFLLSGPGAYVPQAKAPAPGGFQLSAWLKRNF